MLQFKDIVLRMKNLIEMRNVYDCVRPILLVMGLFGVGPSKITKVDGMYSLHNTRYNISMAILTSLCTPWWIVSVVMELFNGETRSLLVGIASIIRFLLTFLFYTTVSLGYIMTRVCCKDLAKVFLIINNMDTKLQQLNIYIKQWKMTLAVTVLGLVTADYGYIASWVYWLGMEQLNYMGIFILIFQMIFSILLHLYYVWVILFLLIIYERFVSINKLFQQNARVTNIRIVGSRNLRDDYLLRRISMVRHLDEQLSEAIVIYSNVFRYIIAGILMQTIIHILYGVIYAFFEDQVFARQLSYTFIFTHCIRIVIMISICQAYKEERRVLTVRLRHLISHETDRRILQQVQQYIMYNATSVPGLIDFQFTGVDNVLLFTIIDIIASNVLIIYSYAR